MLKKNIYLVQVACMSSLVALVVTYIWCYSIASDGLTNLEAAFLTILPGFVFLLVTSFLNTILLINFSKHYEITMKWGYRLLVLSGFIILISFLLDYVYYQFDNTIPKEFASIVFANANVDQAAATTFKKFTFFGMNFLINSICILIGCLIAELCTNSILKRQVKEF